MKRTIEISNRSYLSIENRQLVINQAGAEVGRVPMEDVGELILNNPGITMTQAVMVSSQKNNVVLVVCDEKHLPVSTLLPISEGNRLHSKVLRGQVDVRLSTKKRLWQNIVRQKILNQAETLNLFGVGDKHLAAVATRVKSGDPTNLEATAARYYWRTLFGSDFRRNRHAGGVNALLNYGYSIIRAAVARSLVATGLHPAIGIHHENQYNGLALADDLMEPFRPWVDGRVKELALQDAQVDIDRETKRSLLMLLDTKVQYLGESGPLLKALGFLAAELKRALLSNAKSLNWPTRE